ncbi:cation efflux protein [Favolaschia claudopus]|uniref:Cation efflux protein n=1 Tax=Favolaschia claudopus TaxID=2862362 RepID=A0AAW0DX89_9AGAR
MRRAHNKPNEQENDHSHSHSLSHSHSAFSKRVMAAFSGAGDRGSQITLVGLFANIGLTGIKGVAGYLTHSTALIADAGHSLSDLLGDGVTLVCWRLSRKPPSDTYPFGFAKFETLGTTTVSLLLIGGALGLELLTNVTTAAPVHETHAHAHVHGKVADEENSPVLLANAIHHRSDAYTSIVAFFAILGSWWVPSLPLDPIGGSVSLLRGAWDDLTDAGIIIEQKARDQTSPSLLAIRHIRGRRAGSLIFVDLTADSLLEEEILRTLKSARKEVAEVR